MAFTSADPWQQEMARLGSRQSREHATAKRTQLCERLGIDPKVGEKLYQMGYMAHAQQVQRAKQKAERG